MDFTVHHLQKTLSVTGLVNIHYFEFAENTVTIPDKHPFCELIYVADGSLLIEAENYAGILKKGQLIIHRPNERHSLSCNKTSPSVIIIGFTYSTNELDIFSVAPTEISSTEEHQLTSLINEGRNLFLPPYDKPVFDMKIRDTYPYGTAQIIINAFETFLIELLRNHKYFKYEYDSPIESNKTLPQINKILIYINNNYTDKLIIGELAFLFNTNRTTLCKEFKRVTGKTITNYVIDKKLDLAKEMILSEDKTFTQIAAELNFDSVHYFTKQFTKRIGTTPGEYRKQQKNGTE